jgi:hypothetical protein
VITHLSGKCQALSSIPSTKTSCKWKSYSSYFLEGFFPPVDYYQIHSYCFLSLLTGNPLYWTYHSLLVNFTCWHAFGFSVFSYYTWSWYEHSWVHLHMHICFYYLFQNQIFGRTYFKIFSPSIVCLFSVL